MTVYAFTSFSGSPGVSTLVAALGFHSPRPTLILEGDVTGGSPLTAMIWRGDQDYDRGLLDLAASDPAEFTRSIWDNATLLPGSQDRWLLATIGYPSQAGSLTTIWRPLSAALHAISRDTGMDVLIDVGRLGTPGGAWDLFVRADIPVIVTDTTVPALKTTQIGTDELRPSLAQSGSPDRLAVIPVLGQTPKGAGTRPYGMREVSQALAPITVLPAVPRNERAADKALAIPQEPAGWRRLSHRPNPYVSALHQVLTAAADHATSIDEILGTTTLEGTR